MTPPKKILTQEQKEKRLAEVRKDVAQHQASYRSRALKLFPHICGSCAREFEGLRLKELTVHHKDHNHFNNPPDGSNWELLCLYCHDHEHEKSLDAKYIWDAPTSSRPEAARMADPFSQLDSFLENE